MARKGSEGPDMDKGMRDVIGILLLALALFLLIALFSYDPRDLSFYSIAANPDDRTTYNNLAGLLGANIAHICFFGLGAAAYLLPPALLVIGMGQFFDILGFLRTRWPWLLVWGFCFMGILDLYPTQFENIKDNIRAPSAGGAVGMYVNDFLVEALVGKAGATIVYVLLYILGLIYLTNFEVNEWMRTMKIPRFGFLKTALEKEDEIHQKALELEKEAKRLKRMMKKTGMALGEAANKTKKKTAKSEDAEEEVEEGEAIQEELGADLLPVPEPTIRDLSVAKPRTGKDGEPELDLSDTETKQSEPSPESESSDEDEEEVGEGETIPAEEVRAAATTDEILGDSKSDEDDEKKSEDTADEGSDEKAEVVDEEPEIIEPKPKPKRRPVRKQKPVTVASVPMIGDYRRPDLNFLQMPETSNQPSESREELMANANLMKNSLAQFGIEVSLGDITKGPTITRYELHPAPGVKLEKIVNLSNNITAALKAERINILAPVPGKSSVDIEVPNRVKTKVIMRDLFESDEWQKSKCKIPIALGKDVYGQPLIGDLAEMPHLLIAGSTGSGKSVCISAIIASLLYKFSPDELRMVMIDPKVVELQQYNTLPHLVVPVVTDPKKVILALRWVVNEMENRYKIFAKVGVRNIHTFNKRPKNKPKKDDQPELPLSDDSEGFAVEIDEEITVPREDDIVIPDKLSYIVVVIDELADLMLVAPADVEMSIARITQMARAAGIHMIVATQRPSVDVITGVIKANIPARCAFQVAQKVDSRTILDAMGADKLLGKGDMLYLPPGSAKLIRAQGALVTDEEIQAVVDFITNQGKPSYEMEIHQQLQKPAAMADVEQGASDEDEALIESCIEVIRSEQKASVSLMQRRLRLGYTRAARIMDELEQRGIVGPSKGAEPRDILIDLDGEGYDGM
ncbi:MAG: cell division protein FtsK [Verrucomicrobiales bacterium]|nr:cell division protein FtsK [Verrucomicrobiales bacterium]